MSDVLARDETTGTTRPARHRTLRLPGVRTWVRVAGAVLLPALPFYLDRFWLQSGLFAMAAFVLVLLVPFAYLLSVGALEWGPVKDVIQRLPGPLLRTSRAAHAPDGVGEPVEEAA